MITPWKTTSNLTPEPRSVIATSNGYVLILAPPSKESIPIVPLEGPYGCPYHFNSAQGARCVCHSLELYQEIISGDTGKVPFHQKHVLYFVRHLRSCPNPDPQILQQFGDHIKKFNNQLFFIQESSHSHWPQIDFRHIPNRCLICNNRTIFKDPHGRRQKIWTSYTFDYINGNHTYICRRCRSLLTLGMWSALCDLRPNNKTQGHM